MLSETEDVGDLEVQKDGSADMTAQESSVAQPAEKRKLAELESSTLNDPVDAKKLIMECQQSGANLGTKSAIAGTSTIKKEETTSSQNETRNFHSVLDGLSSCPSLIHILSFLEYEEHCVCRLVNHRLNDVIRRNNFKTSKIPCKGIEIFFQKSIRPEIRVSITLNLSHLDVRHFVITDSFIRKRIAHYNVHSKCHLSTNDVYLTGGIVEGIQRMISRLSTRYGFDTIDMTPCPFKEWVSAFIELPRCFWLQCDKLTIDDYGEEDDITLHVINAESVRLRNPKNVHLFLERNTNWDRMIFVKSYEIGPQTSFQDLFDLSKKWCSGDGGRLLYFAVDLYREDSTPYQHMISSLQSIPAFYIGVDYDYGKAYIRRERNRTSYEENTESVLCFEWRRDKYLLREVNYSGSFDVLPPEEIICDRRELDYVSKQLRRKLPRDRTLRSVLRKYAPPQTNHYKYRPETIIK